MRQPRCRRGGSITDAAAASPALPFVLLLGVAWLLLAGQLLFLGWDATAASLNDTDDAMRLVQVRAFLNGAGWFDLHEARVQPPLGYDTHWSRLIDAGIAGVFLFARVFVDPAMAERLARTAWPLLWLLPAMASAAAIAWRLAGREAAFVALLFAVFGLPLCPQFMPGRIDHHNVQIAVALMTLAAVVWSDRLRWMAGLAGALTGFGLAIGLEALLYLAACGGALTLRYVVAQEAPSQLRAYAVALALSTLAAFLANVPPDRWTVPACDMVAINLLAGVGAGATVLVVGTTAGSLRTAVRSAWVVIAAGATLVAALSLGPRCLGGPFAVMNAEVWRIWLSQVSEMQPLLRTFWAAPLLVMTTGPFLIAALGATLVLANDQQSRRNFALMATTGILLLAIATTLATVKTLSYALWFAVPFVAALAVRLWTQLKLAAPVPRFVAALALTPLVLAAGGIVVTHVGRVDTDTNATDATRKACFATANYASLARLPAGLVFAGIDVGPFLLALTPHAVMATPYHRAGEGILAAHRVLTAPPAKARDLFERADGTYVMTCGPRGPVGLEEPARSASLWAQLQAGNVPDWLEQVPLDAAQPFAVYQVKAASQ